jgi:quinolinate synthase
VTLVNGRRERDARRMSTSAEPLHQPAPHAPGDVRPATRHKPSVLDSPATAAVEADAEIRTMDDEALLAGISKLRRERRALILAHNYQIPAIQDLADFVGDSLELSQRAAESDAPLIVFCGVHFMAETAAILSPRARVLLPDPLAGCSLSAAATADEVRAWRVEHPDGVVVSYINTDAAVKAESDYCCTSANAVDVVRSIPAERAVLFLPDMFLGLYVEHEAGRHLDLWLGECHVHAGLRAEDVRLHLDAHPDAHLLLHPESGCVSTCLRALSAGDLPADRAHLLGTGGMVRHARTCDAEADIIGTEVGLLHRLRKEAPGHTFVPLREDAVCEYMKATTLPKLYRALRDDVYEVSVAPEIAARARAAIDRMLHVQAR